MLFAVALLAGIAAFFSYRVFEEWTGRSWLPAGLRGVGWGALVLLLLNASCPAAPATVRPIVLLDASLSMQAAGGRWSEALELARRLGEVRAVGADRADTMPTGGRSRFGDAVTAAEATGRPVILVSDGEVEDGEEILAGPSIPEIRVLPRRSGSDLALTRVEGSVRVSLGDTLRFETEIEGFRMPAGRKITVLVKEADRVWLRAIAVLDSGGRGRARLEGPVPGVGPGAHVVRVTLADAGDAEPRTDARLRIVHIVPTPGVVLLASPPSWESRFLTATIRDVAAVPVRGYLETEPGTWRRAGDLAPAATSLVAEAARKADLLITLGAQPDFARGSHARGRWSWPAGTSPIGGDWYVSSNGASPASGALVGMAVDSFPPGTAVVELHPAPGDWIGLTAQMGRRGQARPALIGGDSAGIRRVVTGIEGLWRWAFRGGSSEQGYRALVASTVSWLLAGSDSASGKARLQHEVVSRGIPATFEWTAGGVPAPLGIEWMGDSGSRRDTLVFDGSGRASVLLPPGTWRYRLSGGGEGTLAVEDYSAEFLPRPVTLADRPAAVRPLAGRSPVRGWIWLFALAALAFAGEWTARRRLGLR